MITPPNSLSDWIINAGADHHCVGEAKTSQTVITRCYGAKVPDMCYLTSLRSHFFDYPAEELGNQTWHGLALVLFGKLASLYGLDRLSLVANEPVSTNLRTEQDKKLIPERVVHELHTCPNHFVGVRNIICPDDNELHDALSAKGFTMIPTRVVYMFDARSGVLSRSSHLQRDRKNLAKSGIEVKIEASMSIDEFSHIHQLYKDIYIQKHSRMNADYTLKFFQDMRANPYTQYLRLYDKGHLVAFSLLYQKSQNLIIPAVGHKSDTENKGYYRALFAAIANYVESNCLYLNYSSGAGDFKRKRGGVPVLEYTALHAPFNSRLKQKVMRYIGKKAKSLTLDHMIAFGA